MVRIRIKKPIVDSIVRDRVRDNVRDNVRDTVKDKVQDNVRDNVQDRVQDRVQDSINDNVRDSIRDNVRDNVKDALKDNFRDKVRPGGLVKPDSLFPELPFKPPSLIEFDAPQKSLKRIPFTPFYITPDDPADPMDCDRYPDSPYCGGTPLNYKPIALKPSIVIDTCNVGVQLNGTFGFVKVPPLQFVYRDPACQFEQPKIPPLRLENFENPAPVPNGDGYGLVFLDYKLNYQDGINATSGARIQPGAYGRSEYVQSLLAYDIKGKDDILGYIDGKPYVAYCRFRFSRSERYNNNWMYYFYRAVTTEYENNGWEVPSNYLKSANGVWKKKVEGTVTVYYPPFSSKDYSIIKCDNPEASPNIHFFVPYIALLSTLRASPPKNIQKFNTWETEYETEYIFEDTEVLSDYQSRNLQRVKKSYDFFGQLSYYHAYIINPIEIERKQYVIKNLPFFERQPPPPPKPLMTCCPENTDLLRLILAKVIKLSNIVGVDEYPASMPASLIKKGKKEAGQEGIPNLTLLINWLFQRVDEVVGQFEIDIEIEDTDLSQEGNQSKTLHLPNIAESIGEIMNLLIQTSINSELLINVCSRGLLEAGQDKQQNFKNYQALMALIEFMGFNYKESSLKMPLMFKPNEITFDKMLKETEVDVKVIDYEGKGNFASQMQDLLQAAAIIRAVYWRRIDPNQDIKQQVIDHLKQRKEVKDKMQGKDTLEKDLEKIAKNIKLPPPEEEDNNNE